MTPEILAYVRAQAGGLPAAHRMLIEKTQALGDAAEMQIPPEQGALLTFLARLTGARLVLDVGTFTGYSALALAEGTGPDGKVVTFDCVSTWAELAHEAWRDAGVSDRIQPLLGPAAVRLGAMPADPVVDLAFIDADKVSYVEYWELIVPRVRPGGLLIADNVLYAGEVVQPDASRNAVAIREFNAHVLADERVESVLLPIADGVTLARKRP